MATNTPYKGDGHSFDLRVYYEDTDAGGIVYHASYLRFAERARTEMLRSHGFEHAQLLKETGVAFAVRNLAIEYVSPARLDDLLSVVTHTVSVSGARLALSQVILRGEDRLAELKLDLACINGAGRAVRLPEPVRRIFADIG